MSRQGALRLATGCALAALALSSATAAAAPPAAAPHRILVGYEDGSDSATVRARLGLDRVRALRIGARADVIRAAPSDVPGLEATARSVARRPGIAWAQPDYLYEPLKVPRDSFFGPAQWALLNDGNWMVPSGTPNPSKPDADIDADLAWDITTGSAGVTVAVVDTGIYAAHREFQGKLSLGRDFVGADNDPNDQETSGHGSHVAGIVGARADGVGTVGVSWDTRLLAVRAISAVDTPPPGAAFEAVAYAADRAPVVNMSFGAARAVSPAFDAVFRAHPNTLFVAAAGNGAGDGVGDDNDATGFDPCGSTAPNVVCVTSTTDTDTRAGSANYGRLGVDLAAPGAEILSVNGRPATRTPSSYRIASGTSMAAPHVAGIAALLRAGTPWRDTQEIKACILAGVDRIPAMAGITVTGGRANARLALDACADRTPPERAAGLLAPAPGARLRARNAVFRFVPGADLQSGFSVSQLLIDGAAVGSAGLGGASIAPPGVTHGSHTWAIRTLDRSGNVRDSAPRSIQIDNRGPKARIKVLSASARRGVLLRVKLNERASMLGARARVGNGRRRKASLRKSLRKGTRRLRVKLPKKLRKPGKRLRLALKFTDDRGNSATKRVSVRLR